MSRLAGHVDGLVVRFRIEAGNGEVVDADLDTGFTGQIALDSAASGRLAFTGPVALASVELGDGTRIDTPVDQGVLQWFGAPREVQAILTTSPDAAFGMALLTDVVIHVDMPGRAAYLELPS